MNLKESVELMIGIVVAFVPKGLLPTMTFALMIVVKRMAKCNSLVQ